MSQTNKYSFAGIQQIGIGVRNVDEAFAWYRRHFGTDVPIFREAAPAPYMTRYTGDEVQSRDAMFAANLAGGGGFEIWQYTSRTPAPPPATPALGDRGIFMPRIKAEGITSAYQRLQAQGAKLAGGIVTDPSGAQWFGVFDPYGNPFQVIEESDFFLTPHASTGGVAGALIGVSDLDRALPFYKDLLGYDQVIYDVQGQFGDLSGLPGSEHELRRVLLRHSAPRLGAFSTLFGPTAIELVQRLDGGGVPIFADRFWGDLGYIHLCFDIWGMEALKSACEIAGHPFTVDSGTSFDMGEAGGRFAYVEDPDGTLIEFVETHRVPIAKKLKWYLDLRKRDPRKPLPKILLRAMGLGRVRG